MVIIPTRVFDFGGASIQLLGRVMEVDDMRDIAVIIGNGDRKAARIGAKHLGLHCRRGSRYWHGPRVTSAADRVYDLSTRGERNGH